MELRELPRELACGRFRVRPNTRREAEVVRRWAGAGVCASDMLPFARRLHRARLRLDPSLVRFAENCLRDAQGQNSAPAFPEERQRYPRNEKCSRKKTNHKSCRRVRWTAIPRHTASMFLSPVSFALRTLALRRGVNPPRITRGERKKAPS